MSIKQIRERLNQLASEQRATISQKFFKTGPGQYGEGDIFIGVRVPDLRKLARQYRNITIEETIELLTSSIHEERLLALLLLILNFAKVEQEQQKRIYNLYLVHTGYINNWDLVDISAEHIIGAFLFDKDKNPLYRLARSESLWSRRISIMSTFYFIKQNSFSETLKIAALLLHDKEDLIHKAVGWMLREIGKRDRVVEEQFLKSHYQDMPRTMLRYAIEKFPEARRQLYLKGKL